MRLNTSKILNKVYEYGGHLTGHTSRRLRGDVEALKRSKNLGPRGVHQSTIDHVSDLSDKARVSSIKARIGTALGLGVSTAAGYAGTHSYYKNKEAKIMERIDRMYQTGYNQQ